MGLRENLIDIQETLHDYFNNSYESFQPSKTEPRVEPINNRNPVDHVTHHHHHHTHDYYPPSIISIGSMVPRYSQPIIINNIPGPSYHGSSSSNPKHNDEETKEKDKKKDENKVITRSDIVFGMGVVGGVMVATTYFLSQDEYIQFYLSKIDEKMESLKKYTVDGKEGYANNQNDREIRNIIENYDSWKALHEKRTMGKCNAKIVGTGSVVSAITGFFFYSNVALFTGLAGGITCGCYLLWKYLTDNMRKERLYYDQMINGITLIIQNIDTLPEYEFSSKNNSNASPQPIPSAPPGTCDEY